MEIEAKFGVPSEDTFRLLLAADSLDGLSLGAEREKHVHDSYVDTADRLILAAGYSCRRREQPEGVLITLKGLHGGEGAIHRRLEHEVHLAEYVPPSEWPPATVRDMVLGLIGDCPLVPLFDLEQTRHIRPVYVAGRLVAELSLDRVRVAVGERVQSYDELEVELTPEGGEDDLLAAVACLQGKWGLAPVALSKFERGLAFAEVPCFPPRGPCARLGDKGAIGSRRPRRQAR